MGLARLNAKRDGHSPDFANPIRRFFGPPVAVHLADKPFVLRMDGPQHGSEFIRWRSVAWGITQPG